MKHLIPEAKNALLCLGMICLAITWPAATRAQEAKVNESVIELGTRREIFVDHHLIERLNGARLVLHQPRDEGMIFKFDQPWEGNDGIYAAVIKDGSKYRFYYRVQTQPNKGDTDPNQAICYAESPDGINWTKPELGLYEAAGSKKNNIVFMTQLPVCNNFTPFLDTRPGCPAGERFKALGGYRSLGLFAYVSEDGIAWRKIRENKDPLQEAVIKKGQGRFDSQNSAFWSEAEGKYVCYLRESLGGSYRWIARTTSPDFLEWTPAELMEARCNDKAAPPEHLYTNQTHPYFRAPHIYIAIAARFMQGRSAVTPEQLEPIYRGADKPAPAWISKDCSEAVFMTSRGGNLYDRTFMEAFIRPPIGFENWTSRANYPALNVVQTGPAEMSFYVHRSYTQPGAHMRRYSLRLDGFASIQAPYDGGEVLTRVLTFSGRQLRLNYSTGAAGGIRVEIQTADGRPVPGFSLKESRELLGNEIEGTAAWTGSGELAGLAGTPIRLRFVMKDADIYALRFE
ncbi:MAG TPA: hypothetical protein PKM61_02075 [bacterium]|nr:hypothetical protein [bacterium]